VAVVTVEDITTTVQHRVPPTLAVVAVVEPKVGQLLLVVQVLF
jgi:hypothetical protein